MLVCRWSTMSTVEEITAKQSKVRLEDDHR